MPKKFLKKYAPNRQKLTNNKHIGKLARFLDDPNLWHFNRYSVATAFTLGVFFAFMPLPFHTVLSILFAILLRANVPIAAVVVWLNNPLTIGPLFYFSYRFGAWILGHPPEHFNFEFSFHWFTVHLEEVWWPFLLGCLLLGSGLGLLSNLIIRLAWRLSVAKRWKIRGKQKAKT